MPARRNRPDKSGRTPSARERSVLRAVFCDDAGRPVADREVRVNPVGDWVEDQHGHYRSGMGSYLRALESRGYLTKWEARMPGTDTFLWHFRLSEFGARYVATMEPQPEAPRCCVGTGGLVTVVLRRVWVSLSKEPWFRGVCADTIHESFEAGETVEEAVETARMQTEYHDAPESYTFGVRHV